MSMTTATRPAPTALPTAHRLAPRLLGAALALGVAYIHIKVVEGLLLALAAVVLSRSRRRAQTTQLA
jgi:hypothetical protein